MSRELTKVVNGKLYRLLTKDEMKQELYWKVERPKRDHENGECMVLRAKDGHDLFGGQPIFDASALYSYGSAPCVNTGIWETGDPKYIVDLQKNGYKIYLNVYKKVGTKSSIKNVPMSSIDRIVLPTGHGNVVYASENTFRVGIHNNIVYRTLDLIPLSHYNKIHKSLMPGVLLIELHQITPIDIDFKNIHCPTMFTGNNYVTVSDGNIHVEDCYTPTDDTWVICNR